MHSDTDKKGQGLDLGWVGGWCGVGGVGRAFAFLCLASLTVHMGMLMQSN